MHTLPASVRSRERFARECTSSDGSASRLVRLTHRLCLSCQPGAPLRVSICTFLLAKASKLGVLALETPYAPRRHYTHTHRHTQTQTHTPHIHTHTHHTYTHVFLRRRALPMYFCTSKASKVSTERGTRKLDFSLSALDLKNLTDPLGLAAPSASVFVLMY